MLTIYPIQARGFHQSASRPCKVVSQDGAGRNCRKCVTGRRATN